MAYRDRVRRLALDHPLACFAVLACAIGWAPYLGSLAEPAAAHNEPLAPFLAAAIVSVLAGREALRAWGRELARLRPPGWAVAIAFAVPAAIAVASVLANHALGAPLPRPEQLAAWRGLPQTFALFAMVVGIGEEAGWTAFAAPILLRRHGFLGCFGILAALRVLWHLPLVFTGELSWELGLAGNVSFQLLALVMLRSSGSWLPAAIWHSVLNTLGGGFFFAMVEGPDRARLGALLTLGYVLTAALAMAVHRVRSRAAGSRSDRAPDPGRLL
jgi:membrane protease YdiL (CAAX protease family)